MITNNIINYHHSSIVLLSLIISLLSLSCKHTIEPLPEAELTVELEDVSCTEAWIMLKLTNITLPTEVTIYKNNAVAQNNILCYGDTLLYIDSLMPNQTYKFLAEVRQHNSTSNELTFTTLDTTSHNFTFQSWTFGTIGSSSLYDVAIIDENNIWAVGEINVADTSINGYTTYNAVHWNGTEWELKKIGGIGGWTCHTIFAFNENDIWFEGTIHWDGSNYNVHKNGWPLMPNGDGWQVNKMWGSSSNDLYAVGNSGNIAHWDGRKWMKIESGTTVDLLDVWGNPSGSIVWACGYDGGYYKTVLLQYKSKVIKKLYEGSSNNQVNGFYVGLFDGIWTDSENITYLINWGGICSLNFNQFNNFKLITPLLSDIGFSMSASGKNNIFISGQHGLLVHFNGSSIKEYLELRNNKDYLYGINVRNDLVCAVGSRTVSTIYQQVIIHLIKTQGD